MFICKFCSKDHKRLSDLSLHEKHCKLNPSRVQRTKGGSFKPGLATGKASTPEKEKLRISRIQEKAKRNNGGLREGSGRGKSGWYKGFYCRSSWELAFVIYHLDHNSNIQPCKEVRTYTFEGKIRKYYPDFLLNGSVIEIKGYLTEQWKQKHSENPDIVLKTFKDLEVELSYVKSKYGESYLDLYEEKLAELA